MKTDIHELAVKEFDEAIEWYDSDIREFFPTDESVNEALRLILQIAKIPFRHKAGLRPA